MTVATMVVLGLGAVVAIMRLVKNVSKSKPPETAPDPNHITNKPPSVVSSEETSWPIFGE
jgi:hypothetical protein